MNSPLTTDAAASTELTRLRQRVVELQRALAHAEGHRQLLQASALGAAQVGTWSWESDTNRVSWSPQTEEIFGLRPGSFDGTYEGYFALVHPGDRQRLNHAITTAVTERTFYLVEHRILTPSAETRWVACRGRVLSSENGTVSGMVGTVEDITARKQSELAQQAIQETLEARVRERTAGLECAVRELKQEIERRQQAESALKASQQRYQSLYEHNPFMYFTLASDGTVLSVNRFGAEHLGYQPEDLIGRSIADVFDSSERQSALKPLATCEASPYTLLEWEAQKIRKDGTRLWVKERARAIHDHTGTILILVVCEDITERTRAAKQLKETSRLLRTLVNGSALPLISLDRESHVVSWNQAATRLFGWTEKEVLGRELPYVPVGEETMADALWERGIRGEVTGPIELRRQRKDGQMLDLLLWPVFVQDEFEEVALAIGLYVDQSDLKRAEEAKHRSEDRLRSFLNALDDLAFEFDEDGRYLNIWTHNEDRLPLPKPELIGKDIVDVLGPESGAHYLETIRRVITTGDPATIDYTVSLGGVARYFSGVLTLIRGYGAERATVGCVVRDITTNRLADEQVRESEALWRALYEHAGVGIAQLGLDGRILRANPQLCKTLGHSREAMLQQTFHDFTHPDDLAPILKYLGELLASKRPSFSMEKRCRRSDNTWVWVELTVSLVRTASGAPAYFIAVVQHINDRKQAEQQLRESEQAIRSLLEATSNPGLTLDQRIHIVLELGCRRFRLPIGIITGVRADQLELTHIWAPDTTFSRGMRLPLSQTYCGTTLTSTGVVCFEQAQGSEWSTHPGYKALGLECYIGTTLAGEEQKHGTICFMGPEPYPSRFSQADKDFLLLMARWITNELDRQKSEQALRVSELKFRTFVETTLDWVWEVNEHAVYTYASPRVHKILGYEPDEVIGKPLFDLMPPDEALRVTNLFGPIAAAHRPFTLLQNTNRHKDGCLVLLECSGTPIFDEAGVFRGYHGISRDITARKQTEEALRKSEERFEIAFRSSPYPVIMTERDSGRCLEVNEAALKLFGYSREEVIGDTTLTLGLWPSLDDRRRFLQQLDQGETIRNREILFHTKDRRLLTLLVSSEIIELNGVSCLITVGNNITEHKRAEEALRTSELRLQRFVAEAPVGLGILDENWRTISANRALCELTGYEEHEIVGSTYALYTHPEDLAANIALTDEIFRGIRSGYAYEKRYIRKSGEVIWVSVKATRIELSGHKAPLLLAAVQDITERKLAMEERELLSRDLHDNLLQALYAIGMQLEAGKLAMKHSARRSKIHMDHAIHQLNNLMVDVRRFIAFLTKRTPTELDFRQTLTQLTASMTGTAQTTTELDITSPVLSFITPQLAEQLLSIVREALSNSLRHAHASRRWVRLSIVGSSIRLVVGDDGVGFSLTRRRRTGHGLGNMAARARRLSGTFTLQSAPRRGTTITVDVPLKKGAVYA